MAAPKLAPRFRQFSGLFAPDAERILVPEMKRKNEKQQWMLSPGLRNIDFLEALIVMLKRPVVKNRIAAEFEAESAVLVDKLVQIETFGGVEGDGDADDADGVYHVRDVLNQVHVTYGSWTLSAFITEWMDHHGVEYKDDDACAVALKTNSSRKSDYVLRCAIKSYLLTIRKNANAVVVWKIYIFGWSGVSTGCVWVG